MNPLVRALHAERVKARRTGLGRLAAVFPMIAPFLLVALCAARPHSSVTSTEFAWVCFNIWGMMLMPVLTAILALMMVQAEHTQGMWKHLNVLPTPGWSQVLAKHLVAAWLALVASVSLAAYVLFGFITLKLLRPDLGLRLEMAEFWRLLLRALMAFGATLPVLAVLVVVAARARSSTLVVTFSVATVGLFLGLLLPPSTPMAAFEPWSMDAVWQHSLSEPDAARYAWWVLLAAIGWIGMSVAVHVRLQGRKPLY